MKLSCPGRQLHSTELLQLGSARTAGLPAGTKGAVASILFCLPVVKHFFTWMGCLPCDKRHMMGALTDGTSLGVMPEARCVPSCLDLRASGSHIKVDAAKCQIGGGLVVYGSGQTLSSGYSTPATNHTSFCVCVPGQ